MPFVFLSTKKDIETKIGGSIMKKILISLILSLGFINPLYAGQAFFCDRDKKMYCECGNNSFEMDRRDYWDLTRFLRYETDNTALIWAAEEGHSKYVEEFFSCEDVNARDSEGETAFMKASSYGHLQVMEKLLPYSEVDARNNDGETALLLAARNGLRRNQSLKMLLDHGADPNVIGGFGISAVGWAIQRGNITTIKTLLDHGADIHVMGNSSWIDWTALIFASGRGTTDDYGKYVEPIYLVEWLLDEKNMDVNDKTDDGWTALMSAAEEGHPQTVKLLLDHGADVHAATDGGETALTEALKWMALADSNNEKERYKETVKLLKLAGAIEDDNTQQTVKEFLSQKIYFDKYSRQSL